MNMHRRREIEREKIRKAGGNERIDGGWHEKEGK
jgi:hypothetical protein